MSHLRLTGCALALGTALGVAAAGGSAATAEAAEPLRLCTGSPGKTYIAVGEKLAELARQLSRGALTIEAIPTEGSLDNMNRVLAGECDAFISQGDALEFFTRQVNQAAAGRFQVLGELYKELALLLCSDDSGIDDLDEAEGATVAAGGMGTGSLATMLNLRQLEPDAYGGITLLPSNGYEGAVAVVRGEAACLFDVIAPRADLLRTLNDNEQTAAVLHFAEIDNDDLEDYEVDGQRIYRLVTFDDEIYPELAVWGDQETLAISAVLAVDRTYAQANPQALSTLSMLLLAGAGDIQTVAYGPDKPFDE